VGIDQHKVGVLVVEPVFLKLAVFGVDDRERTRRGIRRSNGGHRDHCAPAQVFTNGLGCIQCLAAPCADNDIGVVIAGDLGQAIGLRRRRLSLKLGGLRVQSRLRETGQYSVFDDLKDHFVGEKKCVFTERCGVGPNLVGNAPSLYVRCGGLKDGCHRSSVAVH